MKRRKITSNLKASPKLEELIAQFKPEFGNMRHIDIAETYGTIINFYRLLSLGEKRREELGRETNRSLEFRKEIKREEARLIWMLEDELKK